MPKPTKSRSSKRAAATSRAKRKPAAKATSKPASARSTPRAQAGLDPRVLAAIGLALEDERIEDERARELHEAASGWVALARSRGVRTR